MVVYVARRMETWMVEIERTDTKTDPDRCALGQSTAAIDFLSMFTRRQTTHT